MTSWYTKPLSRVLSIQSHVVRGYVGNKAAVFGLQLLGHHVDFINSVEFTSVYIHEGRRNEAQDLETLLDTLSLDQAVMLEHPGPLPPELKDSLNQFPIDHKFLLTGYVGSPSFLEKILSFVQYQRTQLNNCNLIWLCDPVIGDRGKPYVTEDIISVYKKCIASVDLITPNQYELQWLCNESSTIETLEDAAVCCEEIHTQGPRQIVVTSIELPSQKEALTLLISEKANGLIHYTAIEFPKLDAYLSGTGDLMAAMILDGIDRFHNDLPQACMRALRILQGVMRYTMNQGPSRDIDVIGSASVILNPPAIDVLRTITFTRECSVEQQN